MTNVKISAAAMLINVGGGELQVIILIAMIYDYGSSYSGNRDIIADYDS